MKTEPEGYDVVAVNIATGKVRLMAVDLPHFIAIAMVAETILRRRTGGDLVREVRTGKFKDGDDYAKDWMSVEGGAA